MPLCTDEFAIFCAPFLSIVFPHYLFTLSFFFCIIVIEFCSFFFILPPPTPRSPVDFKLLELFDLLAERLANAATRIENRTVATGTEHFLEN